MKKLLIPVLYVLFILPLSLSAQLPQTKLVKGSLRPVEPGMTIIPPKTKYSQVADSLDKNLKLNPNDTTSLFYRSLIYYTYNQMMAKPEQNSKAHLKI